MKCELKTLTPVHVGSGIEISPIEYLVDDSKFYRVDVESLFMDDNFDKKRFLNFVEQCTAGKKQPYLGEFDRNLPKKYVKYVLDTEERIDKKQQIKEHIKTSWEFYVPGSSIKGSILSAIYWYALKEQSRDLNIKKIITSCLIKDFRALANFKKDKRYGEFIVGRPGKIDPKDTLMNFVFDYIIQDKSKFKPKEPKELKFAPWIQVTDTNTISEDDAYLVCAKSVGAHRGIFMFYEVIKPGSVIKFEMRQQNVSLRENEILKIVDDFYSKVLQMEESWIKRNNISLNVSELKNKKYKLRLGQGSSSLATSLLILAKELRIENEYLRKWRVTRYSTEPKTRKIVLKNGEPLYPLGWVKLKGGE